MKSSEFGEKLVGKKALKKTLNNQGNLTRPPEVLVWQDFSGLQGKQAPSVAPVRLRVKAPLSVFSNWLSCSWVVGLTSAGESEEKQQPMGICACVSHPVYILTFRV